MENEKLSYNISEKYSQEISDIQNILTQLENGRIYEFSNARMDGTLNHNVGQLREHLNDLLYKIQNCKESDMERLAREFQAVDKKMESGSNR